MSELAIAGVADQYGLILKLGPRRHIAPSVVAKMKEKVARLGISPDLTVRSGLIYQGELHPEIPEADYFDHLVPFEKLLRLP